MTSPMLEIHILTARKDNYIYVLRDPQTQTVGVIDPTTAEPVIQFLKEKNWPLDVIFITHHHHDHVGGNLELQKIYASKIFCSEYDRQRVPGAQIFLQDDERLMFGHSQLKVLFIPGHTLGAIAFYFDQDKIIFTGDTLFTMGCGRLFEGTPKMMFESLNRLAQLPGDTLIYSGHEFGLQNSAFAALESPGNPELNAHFLSLKKHLEAGGRSVPSPLRTEKQFNPFLTARNLNEFTLLRRRKDDFKLEDTHLLG